MWTSCVFREYHVFAKRPRKCMSSLREDTLFVNVYLLEKEAKEVLGEFLYDGYENDGRQKMSSKKLKEKLKQDY